MSKKTHPPKLTQILGLSAMAGLELLASYQVISGVIQQISSKSALDELNKTSEHYADKPYLVKDRAYVDGSENFSAHLVGGFITFDTTGTVAIIESEGCDSITDNGLRSYDVNLGDTLESYICTYIASEHVNLDLTLSDDMIRVRADRDYEGIIKLIFFEKVLDVELSA